MSFTTILYKLLIGPVELLFETVFAFFYRHTLSPSISVVFLSLTMNLLILPLYRRADAIQSEERALFLRLKPGIDHIKKTFQGDERFMMLQTYYKLNNYKPYYSLRNSVSLLLQIPFFIAAYNFLSRVYVLKGASLWIISDLGSPDGLVKIGAHTINALPIIMTFINIAAGMVYTKGFPKTQKIQLYGMALIFLVLLYNSPSGLVFYWTLNNLFSLIKNIIYKLKNPKKATRSLSSVVGIVLLAFIFVKFGSLTWRVKVFGVFLAICLQLPVILQFSKQYKTNVCHTVNKNERLIFTFSCIFLTLLTGLLIPSAVIGASAEEFVDISSYKSPLWYVLSSFLLASGTFLLWLRIFYSLMSPRIKKIFSYFSISILAIATVNYMIFVKDYGSLINNALKFIDTPIISRRDQIINFLVCFLVFLIVFILWKKFPSITKYISLVACVAVSIMSIINVYSIQKETKKLKVSIERIYLEEQALMELDKSANNVLIIMMDRAIGTFFPYLLNEKPELKDKLEGFTYYPNTFSYGAQTLTSVPSLFGGYDYTPLEIERRKDVSLKDKHNEALQLMPFIFHTSGYDVSVFNPPLAGYRHTPDLSIYDKYPEIKTSVLSKEFVSPESMEKLRHRNFFFYSIFRISPLVIQYSIYDSGMYNSLPDNEDVFQTLNGLSKASGTNIHFMHSYYVLSNISEMTNIRDTGKGNFIMLTNDMTHEPTLLQKPDYEPSGVVDNSDYDNDFTIHHAWENSSVKMTKETQVKHYHVNMACLIQLGKWFDFMRENEVYDNTRIIVVGDHGTHLFGLFDTLYGNEDAPEDIVSFAPLLLVKDFDSNDFTVDEMLMSTADVPLIAFSNLIEDPINPANGRPLSDKEKHKLEHLLVESGKSNPDFHTGNTFIELTWYSFNGDNIYDKSAWNLLN